MTRHPMDAVALVFGLLFLAVAGGWLAQETTAFGRSDVAWAAPVALIVAGAVGVLVSLRR